MSEHGDDGGAAFGGMGGLQMMGIMNALKTGDVRMDMLVAMCIPIVLRLAFDLVTRLSSMWRWEDWMQWYFRRQNEYERFITYKSTRNSWGGSTSWDSDTQNTVLIKAIQLYMHHELDMNFSSAYLDLTSMDDKGANLGYYDYGGSDDDSEIAGNSSRKTLVGVLSKYKIIQKPPEDTWHQLGVYGSGDKDDEDSNEGGPVRLLISRQEQSVGNDGNARQYCTLTFHFVSPSETAIDDFVNTAYRWYMDQLRSLEDNARYLYELKSLSASTGADDGDSGSNSNGMLYTRYKLSNEKTFDSLFFPQKDTLLSLIQHFTNKSGKYAIPGYPHKLGLLLHGPPGTGKTSLIKALAQATGRSIVNVALARISTNSELMSIFFDKKYHIEGEDVPVKLGFKDIIFVMEDVDAVSSIVKRR
jgi:chaperone BCS1